ncbi:MAG: class I SAM-dependent methyltransferase [Steroidobacteraceae bacterium]
MLLNEPDQDWEKIGRKGPYFGVLRHPQYRTRSLTDAAREQFFQSGEARIRTVIDTVAKRLGVELRPRRALDFGCGVGRLLIPLARLSGEATGIDISDSMRAEAQRNCEARGVGNVRVARDLSALEGSYDFIHSHIVFQHMKVARGEAAFAQLLGRLAPGGIGVVHFTYAKS